MFATISEARGTGKTTTFALGFAYRTLYDPACMNFYTTYESGRADGVGRATRRLVEGLGVPLDRSARAVDEWKTVFGGGLLSTSIGGRITGEGANGGLIVVDDLIKGWKESRSKSRRDDAWNYFTMDVMSRTEGGSSVIVMNTRWHDDDIIGRIKKNPLGFGEIAGTKAWEHINMPAIHDGNFNPIDEREHPMRAHPLWLDVDSAHPGDVAAALLWYKLARARGEHGWWALYQGMPRKDGGKVFNNPARYTLPRSKPYENAAQPFDWDGWRGCISIDTAGTEKKRADHTGVSVLAGKGHGADDMVIRLVDATKRQISVPEGARQALAWKRRYGLPLVIEGGNMGANAVIQVLKELEPELEIELAPMFGDKFTRAQPMAGMWNSGRWLVPTYVDVEGHRLEHVEWIDNVIDQADAFTGEDGNEDDLIDACSGGTNYLLGSDRAWRAAQ